VRNLLDFARRRPLTLKEVDVSRRSSRCCCSSTRSRSGHRLERICRRAEVRADYGQLRQAFVNIALNACEAMSKGSTLKVTSRLGPARR
jgi:two-component system NtrC family sensor kinase